MNKHFMVIAIVILCSLLFWLLAGYFTAWYMTRTANSPIPKLEEISAHKITDLKIITEDSVEISAWFVETNPERVIILLSGIRCNRLDQVDKAKFFIKQGFSVLMPDLRATGTSKGDFISFGRHESKDVIACATELKRRGFIRISAFGQSLGAATLIFVNRYFTDFEFLILSSSYDNIENAFKNRIKKFHLPEFAYLPVIHFVEKKLNTTKENLCPENFIRKVTCPVLILAGDCEVQIPLHETQKLYENCPSPDKKLHIFEKGVHGDFYRQFPDEFVETVLNFLSKLK